MGDTELFRCGFASHRSVSVFLPNGQAWHREFLLRDLSRPQRQPAGRKEQLPTACSGVREFWSVTVYSLETSSFFLNATRLTLGSLDKDLRKNADGSVDIYFGPKPPAGEESNWLYTQTRQKWFPWFRAYGPENAVFDKSWKLPDIEIVK